MKLSRKLPLHRSHGMAQPATARAGNPRLKPSHLLGWSLAAALLVSAMLACRFTAGPPPTPSPLPRLPIPSALAGVPDAPPTPTRLLRVTLAGPTKTPVLLPSPSPNPTLLPHLPAGLPLIRPEGLAGLRPLVRLGSSNTLPFTSLAFSPDGRYLAAIDCSQDLQLWEVASGNSLNVQAAGEQAPCQGSWPALISPAGRLLVTTQAQFGETEHGSGLQIWTLSPYYGARTAQELNVTSKIVTSLAFSPDGHLLAAATTENLVKLWYFTDPLDAGAGLTELGSLPHADWVTSLAISPDGRLLATASAGPSAAGFAPLIHLWRIPALLMGNADSVEPEATINASAGPIRQLAFSPDSQWLASAGETLVVRGLDGNQAASFERTAGSLAFSPDGDLLASGGQAGLSLWHLQPALRGESRSQPTFFSPAGEIRQLAFHPNGRSLAVLHADGSLWLWGIPP